MEILKRLALARDPQVLDSPGLPFFPLRVPVPFDRLVNRPQPLLSRQMTVVDHRTFAEHHSRIRASKVKSMSVVDLVPSPRSLERFRHLGRMDFG